MKIRQIINMLEQVAPSKLAESWDNCGLAYGDVNKDVSSILIALEPTEKVIDEAIEKKADMIITHHPMIFSPIKSLSLDKVIARKITKLAKNDIVCYSMHTNMDIAIMASVAANKLDLKDVSRLEQVNSEDDSCTFGLGSVGNLSNSMSLEECAEFVKSRFVVNKLRVAGELKKLIKKVAILPGSGKSYINKAISKEADVLITGDIDYHSAIDALEAGICVIDAGHFDTEHFFVEYIYEYLKKNISEVDITLNMAIEKSPFTII